MKRVVLSVLLILLVVLAAACSDSTTTTTGSAPPDSDTSSSTESPTTTAAPEPTVGGTVVMRRPAGPGTLDPHQEGGSAIKDVMEYVGGSLVTRDPASNEIIPYLAESWTTSDDGLMWEFKLKPGIKFHDGTPLTAGDYAWTLQRGMNIESKSNTASNLAGVTKIEAPDDLTLRFTLSEPNYYLLGNLSDAVSMQPMSKAYTEKVGDTEVGRAPVSVGPFMFKEWLTDDKIVLERNPDYTWGPEYTGGKPPYIQTLEIRFIPEYSTALAGLEAGEIDYTEIEPKDVERLQAEGSYQLNAIVLSGSGEIIMINTSKAPFDDPNVRLALNYATDRDGIVTAVSGGTAKAQYGPLTPNVQGYWDGVDGVGQKYDVDQAKESLATSGWADTDGDGIVEKDGQPLKLVMKVASAKELEVKIVSILKEQWKAAGVDLQIEAGDLGVIIGEVFEGKFDMTPAVWRDASSRLLYTMYYSGNIGSMNMGRVDDPTLDTMLTGMVTAKTDAENLQAAEDAQKYLTENALLVPVYSPLKDSAFSERVKGWMVAEDDRVIMSTAYVVE